MAEAAIHLAAERLTTEISIIRASLKSGAEATLSDMRWTQLLIAETVLALTGCIQTKVTPRPRWQEVAVETVVKWGTMAVIGMILYLFIQVVNSGFHLPIS